MARNVVWLQSNHSADWSDSCLEDAEHQGDVMFVDLLGLLVFRHAD